MRKSFEPPQPGTIFSTEATKKVRFAAEKAEALQAGVIVKISKILPEKIPVFCWKGCLNEIKGAFDEFRENESKAILSHFFDFKHPGALEFTQDHIYSRAAFFMFLKKHYYISRLPVIKSIDFLVKKSAINSYCLLLDHKEHLEFINAKYIVQQRKNLQQKRTLELNLKTEFDLQQEKEALKELTRLNRPFLSVGAASAKSSKHVLCISKRQSKKIKAQIEEKTQALELQMNLAQSIWEKNVKNFCFKALSFYQNYSYNRKVLINAASSSSCLPVVYYIFTAWTAYVQLKLDKKHCIKIAKNALGLHKKLKILHAWHFISTKPARISLFLTNIEDYLKSRKASRLFISWKWFSCNKKLKECMNILAKRFYREKLKAKKFFELNCEVKIIIGSRDRYQTLAKGEESEFSLEETVVARRFLAGVCLRKVVKGLSRYKEEMVMLAQECFKIQQIIATSKYYPEAAESWRKYLMLKYKKN